MKHSVYRAFDHDRSLLYVGCSIEPMRRMKDHDHTSTWYQQVRYIELEWFDNREEALAAEAKAILDEKPAFNRSGTSPEPLEQEADIPLSREERKREMARLRQKRKRARDNPERQARVKDSAVKPFTSRGRSSVKGQLLKSMAEQHGVHTMTIRRWLAQGKIQLQEAV